MVFVCHVKRTQHPNCTHFIIQIILNKIYVENFSAFISMAPFY